MKMTAAQYRAKFSSAKPRRRPVQHEERLQIAVAAELRRLGLCFYHPANEGDLPVQYRVKLKRKGTSAGMPDVLVFDPITLWNDTACGLAIELKNGKAGRTSPAQQQWMEALFARDWRVEVCRSLDEVLDLLRECYPHKFPKAA